MVDPSNFIEPVYDLLRSNAGMDESGVLVTHVPIHPWLVDVHGLTEAEAKEVRERAVKELEAQGRIRRDHPRTTKVWVLK